MRLKGETQSLQEKSKQMRDDRLQSAEELSAAEPRGQFESCPINYAGHRACEYGGYSRRHDALLSTAHLVK